MTNKPITRESSIASCLSGSQRLVFIPTEHAPLPAPKDSDLDRWIDDRLAELEGQFASYRTNSSVRKSLGR